jgi:uncharacterized GH25 family protein
MNLSNIHDTTHLVIQGHEGWMEFRSSHGHHGSPVEVLFKWGDRMKSDGLCKKKLLKAYMIDPNGNKTDLSVEDHDETSYKLSFTPESAGLYRAAVVVDGVTTVTVDGQYLDIPKKECDFPLESIAFTQYASAVIPVGHHPEGNVHAVGGNLELLPAYWKSWRVGDTIELMVTAKGSSAAGTEVTLINGMAEGEEPALKETDSEGKVAFTFEKPGFYLAMVRYADNDDSKEGYYDRRNYTATLFILVTK